MRTPVESRAFSPRRYAVGEAARCRTRTRHCAKPSGTRGGGQSRRDDVAAAELWSEPVGAGALEMNGRRWCAFKTASQGAGRGRAARLYAERVAAGDVNLRSPYPSTTSAFNNARRSLFLPSSLGAARGRLAELVPCGSCGRWTRSSASSRPTTATPYKRRERRACSRLCTRTPSSQQELLTHRATRAAASRAPTPPRTPDDLSVVGPYRGRAAGTWGGIALRLTL